MADGEVLDGYDLYAYGLDPKFDWRNDTTNNLTVVGRGTTFTVHGHIWQRDPYVCPDETTDGIPGKCANVDMSTFRQVGSLRIGDNPIGMTMGGQVWVQIVSVVVTIVWTGIISFILFKVIDAVIGLRVPEDEEREGSRAPLDEKVKDAAQQAA